MHITCHRSHLEERCRERGYSLQEVMQCVTKINGDIWTIDVDHPDYPRHKKTAQKASGPGTELKKLLSSFGINAEEKGCKCKSRARKMDRLGIRWCEENIETIVTWLQEEAAKRRLPFLRAAGKIIVKRAISNARRAK